MRGALLISAVVVITLSPNTGTAGPRTLHIEPSDGTASSIAPASFGKYRGYSFDLSESSERKDAGTMADILRRQLDVVDASGFSPRVLQFFRSIPIVASEMSCLDDSAAVACYGRAEPEQEAGTLRDITTWDSETHQWTNSDPVALAIDSGTGIIRIRPTMMRYEKEPVMLHEFLHAYHARLLPAGYENKGIKNFYAEAQAKSLYPKEEYVLKNNREFFAVTASIFLSGKDSFHEPHTRAKLKEQMPEYYKYLVGVFGFDPDAPTPVASAN